MDIDAMGKHIHGLLAFKTKIEDMMGTAETHNTQASDTLSEMMAFKADFETALPDIRKAIADASSLADDIMAIKHDLAPVLAWVAEQQKAAAEAKEKAEAEEKLKAEAVAKHEADGKTAAEKPLAHVVGESSVVTGAEFVSAIDGAAEGILGSQADHVDTVAEHPAS